MSYHEGELEIQRRAGVESNAAKVGRSIRSEIPEVAQEFLRNQPLAILASVDPKGRVWASALTGQPGFLQAVDSSKLRITAQARAGDPWEENLRLDARSGLLAIDFANRRRMRINGRAELEPNGLLIHTREVFSNCPRYIQARTWTLNAIGSAASESQGRSEQLDRAQQDMIGAADTFFIASMHASAGADASHRGGNPGFVRVLSPAKLEWADYAGNSMFQTLGNMAVNPFAGLLFIDWDRGNTLQLTGRASIVWDRERVAKTPGAERLIEFGIEEVVDISGSFGLRWRFLQSSPHNPE